MEKILEELVKQHGDKLDLSKGNEYYLVLNDGIIMVTLSDENHAEMNVKVFKAGRPYVYHTDAKVEGFLEDLEK